MLGASEYTVQLSGITSFIPTPETTLPRRNLQVARPDYVLGDVVEREAVASAIEHHLAAFGLHDSRDRRRAGAAVERHRRATGGCVPSPKVSSEGLRRRVADGRPIYLMIDGDIALTLGTILRDELSVTNDLLILDGIDLRDFDFVDLGRVPPSVEHRAGHHQIVGVRRRAGRYRERRSAAMA